MSRAARFTTTRAGIQIGCAYVPPPQRPGSEAERIQRGLLTPPKPPNVWDYLAAGLADLLLRLDAAWQDFNLRAVYAASRRRGMSRWQSIRRAVWCCIPSTYLKAKR